MSSLLHCMNLIINITYICIELIDRFTPNPDICLCTSMLCVGCIKHSYDSILSLAVDVMYISAEALLFMIMNVFFFRIYSIAAAIA